MGGPLLALCLLSCVGLALSAPGRSADEVLIGQVDIAMRGDDDSVNVVDNSIDRQAEETFSKKCFVDNKYYSHSEMIPSRDLGSHCLCVAGEVYCWWQTYGGQRVDILTPKSTQVSEEEAEEDSDSVILKDDPEQEENSEASGESSAEASGQQQDDNSESDSDDLTEEDEEEEEEDDDEDEGNEEQDEDEDEEESAGDNNSSASQKLAAKNSTTTTSRTTTAAVQSTRAPSTCLVMGRTYQEGEVLPRLTGNCVECSCGRESRIQCSPRDCVSLRPQLGGGGDGLELFGLERDRGLVGSF